MDCVAFSDPMQFAEAIDALGERSPVSWQHIRTALWAGQEVEGWTVWAEGEAVGALLPLGERTALGATSPSPEIATALAECLPTQEGRELLGEPALVAAVAGRWSERSGGGILPVESLRTYTAGPVVLPDVDGRARPAEPHELDHLFEWGTKMVTEVGEQPDPERFRASVARRHNHEQFWFWEVAGVRVSQLFRSREAYGHVRIGGVYTPPEFRGRGYGAAITAAVARDLQAEGLTVMLNTQAHNAPSNRLYRRIGFENVGELLVLRTT